MGTLRASGNSSTEEKTPLLSTLLMEMAALFFTTGEARTQRKMDCLGLSIVENIYYLSFFIKF